MLLKKFFQKRELTLLSAPVSRKFLRILDNNFSPRVSILPIESDNVYDYDDFDEAVVFSE